MSFFFSKLEEYLGIEGTFEMSFFFSKLEEYLGIEGILVGGFI